MTTFAITSNRRNSCPIIGVPRDDCKGLPHCIRSTSLQSANVIFLLLASSDAVWHWRNIRRNSTIDRLIWSPKAIAACKKFQCNIRKVICSSTLVIKAKQKRFIQVSTVRTLFDSGARDPSIEHKTDSKSPWSHSLYNNVATSLLSTFGRSSHSDQRSLKQAESTWIIGAHMNDESEKKPRRALGLSTHCPAMHH